MTSDPLAAWAARHGVSHQALSELATIYDADVPVPAGASEAAVQAQLRLTAPSVGGTLWRNNQGACLDETGRMVRYGLGNDSKRINAVWKSSDLIGITRGVFTAVEVKAPGWSGPRNDRDRAQEAFLNDVNRRGGLGLFATSVEHYITAVRERF